MLYPGNYGFIPQTKSQDGDAIDVLILFDEPLVPLCVIDCRPIGMLLTEDQSGIDSKVIAVPVSKIDSSYDQIKDIVDVNKSTLDLIMHFFQHHKDLEEDKYVKILGWKGREYAMKVIQDALAENG
jgi:inorganic pyrophosphatase